MDLEWCVEKLESLKIKENRLDTLAEIRGQLNSSAKLEAIITNRLLAAAEIYECLEELDQPESKEQLAIATDILSICMANLSISNEHDLPQLLHRALTHPRTQVRALALKTILKEMERNDGALQLSDELLQHVLQTLRQNETEVGVPSISILSLVLEERIDDVHVRETLLRMLTANEIVKCRVYELAVNLAKRSPATLQRVEYLLDNALAELDNDDILLQVNILEILVPLAEQNHGLLYMERREVFGLLSKRVELLEQNPIDHLLVPGIMKFFGKVASMQPQKIILGYRHMLECLFNCLQSEDMSLLPVAFDTLANVAHTQQGKILLDAHYVEDLQKIFIGYSSYLRNLSSELKNRAFSTLEGIFTSTGDVTPQLGEILQRWFTYLAGGNTMQFLLDFCRNPFPDIKVACLSFIRALCAYTWGIVALKQTGGFVEYLLDRKIEFDKEAKYAKYEVIKLLADSDIFDMQIKMQLRVYVNEGPYFVVSAMEIAVEGN